MRSRRGKEALTIAAVGTLLAACSGGGSSSSSPASINSAPTVSVGSDQTVAELATVSLSGTVFDPDDSPVLLWSQIEGPLVQLSNEMAPSATFMAPRVPQTTELVFRLTADDGSNPPASDSVTVTITDGGITVSSINPAGQSYIDPELHPLRAEMVFQTNTEVWIGALDLATGRFVSSSGKDSFVDNTISLSNSKNGPEYGLDSSGVSVFYNSEGTDGSFQFSRATELGIGSYATEQLTPNGSNRVNQLPSQDQTSPTTYLAYGRETIVSGSPTANGYIAYLDESQPGDDQDVTELRPGFAGFRWLKGSTFFTTTIAEDGPDQGQIKLINAATGVERVITNDAGIKFDPFPWFAPEFGGAIAVHANVNQTDIAVYVDRGGTYFERVALLTPPNDTDLSFVQSPEPFVTESGTSYITLTLKDDPGSVFSNVSDSEIWIYGISDGPDRFTLNCGDGLPNRVRHEAESLSGEDQLFVYYNEILTSGLFDLILCETGLAP